jgi:hypothetical protein
MRVVLGNPIVADDDNLWKKLPLPGRNVTSDDPVKTRYVLLPLVGGDSQKILHTPGT